ncbi:ATP-grasp fold amidoligase family protein [uncultured Thiodictyon sp.]|jgi:hypothetical protein|uniref:ATP-grasp fold amidoligase family protein n=1 Tax=uncultured Thiodictyon sp. TaxID=1846217 RepID=UPI0025F1EB59|nr:ATP-grasp fold amidoligase family protein [uncultured Thiodictyon sp.]
MSSNSAFGSFISNLERVGLRLKRTRLAETRSGRVIVDLILWPTDLVKILRSYHASFGVYPNLLRPRGFNDFLQQSKLFRRKRRYTQCADKVAVRDYVASVIGPQYLNQLYWVGTDLREAPRARLPQSFVIKSNQGSGTILIVKDATVVDWNAADLETRRWLRIDHSVHFAEWQYRWIKPRLLIERLLTTSDGSVPLDYKFFCFHGQVELVQVDFDRFTGHSRALFDRHFSRLPVRYQFPPYGGALGKPACFEQLVQLAERLAGDEPFVRVDFYDVEGPVFGEMTYHPGAGLEHFDPPEWDLRLGALLRGRRRWPGSKHQAVGGG